jgi:hypothetical protein
MIAHFTRHGIICESAAQRNHHGVPGLDLPQNREILRSFGSVSVTVAGLERGDETSHPSTDG